MALKPLSPSEITSLFAHPEGFHAARWGRPIAPVVFGVDDNSLTHIKSALTQTVGITGQGIAETDPELGANLMWFFCSEWSEILAVPDLDRLIPNLGDIIAGLEADNVNAYRSFSFDETGAIKLAVIFTRMQGEMADMPIQTLVTGEMFQTLALWAPGAFAATSPIALVKENNICVVKPEFAALIRAIYAPELPPASTEVSTALRLAARADIILKGLEIGP